MNPVDVSFGVFVLLERFVSVRLCCLNLHTVCVDLLHTPHADSSRVTLHYSLQSAQACMCVCVSSRVCASERLERESQWAREKTGGLPMSPLSLSLWRRAPVPLCVLLFLEAAEPWIKVSRKTAAHVIHMRRYIRGKFPQSQISSEKLLDGLFLSAHYQGGLYTVFS